MPKICKTSETYLKKAGLMVDCSRNAVPTVETLKRLADMML